VVGKSPGGIVVVGNFHEIQAGTRLDISFSGSGALAKYLYLLTLSSRSEHETASD
jgi:hypothetical protein